MQAPILHRLCPTDLGERWHKTLSVPPGHRALLYTGHDYRGIVGPGSHTLDTRLARLNRLGEDNRPGAVLLRDDPWEVNLHLQALVDETPLTAQVALVLAISDPALLVTELLGSRPQLTLDELAQRLVPALNPCLQPTTDDPQRVAARLAADLGTWLGDWGLRLAAVPRVQLQENPQQRLRQQQAVQRSELQHRLGQQKLEADFQRGERVAEAHTEAEIGDIQRGQARADLGLEAERERLWRERLVFLVELGSRWC